MRAWVAVGLLLAAAYTALVIPFSPQCHPGYHPLITLRRHPIG